MSRPLPPRFGRPDLTAWQRDLQVGGRSVRIVDIGPREAPVLVFLHGIMGRWQHWSLNIPFFARDYRVIALDFPGFGESQMPAGRIDLEVYRDMVADVCGQLGVKRATVIGNSMGGMLATMLAKARPDLVERLVLMNGAGFTTAEGYVRKLRPLIARLNPMLKLGFRLSELVARNRLLRFFALGVFVPRPGRLSYETALDLVGGAGREAFLPILPHVIGDRIDLKPGEVTCPTLIIWGRLDLVIPRIDARRYAQMIPQARTVLMRRAGHLAMLEQPTAFNWALGGFLAEPLLARAAFAEAELSAASPAS